MQDDKKHIAEADQVLGNRTQTTSDMNVGTHLSDKEVSTDALLKNEAVFEVCNVELIGLKISMIQCPSCLHNIFKRGTSLSMRKAHQTRPGCDATNQSCL